MKKALYVTSALVGVLALGAGDVMAAKLKIGMSGFFNSRVGVASQSGAYETSGASASTAGTKYSAFDVKNDSEVAFSGSSKLDNGITVSLNMQLETDNTSSGANTIDESSLKLTGAFGDIRLGTIDGAAQVLRHTAPGNGVGAIGIGGGDAGQWIVKPASVTAVAGSTGFDGGGDSMKVLYISPKMNGWRVGATYAPSTTHATGMAATGGTGGTETAQYDGTVSYENKLGKLDIKADLAYFSTEGTAATGRKGTRGGLNVGFGNFTVGGSVLEQNDMGKNVAGTSTTTAVQAREYMDVGIQYKVNKDLSISAVYLTGDSAQTIAIPGGEKSVRWTMNAGYTMGPGVSLGATILHAKWQDETTVATNNNDGYAFIGAVKVKF